MLKSSLTEISARFYATIKPEKFSVLDCSNNRCYNKIYICAAALNTRQDILRIGELQKKSRMRNKKQNPLNFQRVLFFMCFTYYKGRKYVFGKIEIEQNCAKM